MNEQLKAQLETFISGMLTRAENATVWAEGEIPLLIQEWLTWLFFESALWSVVFFIAFAVFTTLYVFMCRLVWGVRNTEELIIPASFAYLILGGGSFVLFMQNFLDVVKIWVAPRVVILEKGLSLLGAN